MPSSSPQKYAVDQRVRHKDGWEGTIALFVPAGMMRHQINRYLVNKPDDVSGKVWANEDELEPAENA